MECRCLYFYAEKKVCVQDCPLHYKESARRTNKRLKARDYERYSPPSALRTDGWGRDWVASEERLQQEYKEDMKRLRKAYRHFKMYSDNFIPKELR